MSRGRIEEVSFGVASGEKFEPGLVRGVKILGYKSRNKRRYSKAVVTRAVPKYEGARVNIDHPEKDGQSRSYASRFGSLSNVRMAEGGMFGDLKYNPKHPLAAQFEYDAEHSPESVGLSHVVMAQWEVDKAGTMNVTEIDRVTSVDLVADPATTSSLFEAEQEDEEVADLTLEAVKADEGIMKAMREEILAEQADSEAAKKAAAEQAALLKENEQLKAEASRVKRVAAVDAAIKEAQLPEAMAGGAFREACMAADEEGLKTLVTEQASAYKKLTEEWEEKKPTSKGKSPAGADTKKLRDGKAFASTVTE